MDAPQKAFYDKLKSDHGGFAAIAWLIIGAYLFYAEPAARLFSWQALVYFVVGMFAAAILLGGLSYMAMRGVGGSLTNAGIVTAPTARAATGLLVMGWVLFAAQSVLIYFVARWTIRAMF